MAVEIEQVAVKVQAPCIHGCTAGTSIAQVVQALMLMMLHICCGCYRRQLERANAEEEQVAAEALKQVQAEQQRDHHTNFHLHLQAEEIKVRTMSPLPSLLCLFSCFLIKADQHSKL